MQLYANTRPIRCLTTPRLASVHPSALDWLLVRENSEGEDVGQPWEVATETSI